MQSAARACQHRCRATNSRYLPRARRRHDRRWAAGQDDPSAAIALGQTLRVLAAGPDDPAAQVSPDVVIGAHTDLGGAARAAAGVDALTFDHEHVPTELLSS